MMHANIAAVLAVATALAAPAIVPESASQSRLVGPSISSVSPAAPSRGASAQTLTISGSNFSPGLSLEVASPDGRTLRFAGSAIESRRERFAPGLSVYLTDPIGGMYAFKGRAVGPVTSTSFAVSVVLDMEGEYGLMVTSPSGESSDSVVLKVSREARHR